MIIRKSGYVNEVRSQMRGGEGDTVFDHICQAGQLPPKCRIFSLITLNPGCSIGYHVHEGESELYLFIEGKATLDDNGAAAEAEAGDTMLTPSGSGHAVSNKGTLPLKFLAAVILD